MKPWFYAILMVVLFAYVCTVDYQAAITYEKDQTEYRAPKRGDIEFARDNALAQGDADAARKLQAFLAQ